MTATNHNRRFFRHCERMCVYPCSALSALFANGKAPWLTKTNDGDQSQQTVLPSLLACVLATSVGNMLSRSIYDSILYTKGLPYLPRLSRLPMSKTKCVSACTCTSIESMEIISKT